MGDNLINKRLADIPVYNEWTKIKHINKGWSKDKKYYIEDMCGGKFLLRISYFKFYDIKKKEFETMKDVYKLGINMSKPIDFGVCGNGKYVYSLLSWVEGKPADEVIKKLSREEQYKLGVEAGKILKKIHSIPAPLDVVKWEEKMLEKINSHLNRYKESGIRVLKDKFAINHVEKNLYLLNNRPQAYQHGDFHVGNLIVTPNNTLGVIDFNRWDYGDPIEEFYKMMIFSRELSIPFAIGQIKGYYKNEVPKDFFDILSLYVADIILFSIVWAIPFGEHEVKGMIKRAEMIAEDYNNFNTTIPKWYK